MSQDVTLIEPASTALVIIDTQTKLAAAMPEPGRASCLRHIDILVETARHFELPVLVTEQYPAGLGPTVEPIRERLATFEDEIPIVEKVEFDATSNASFAETLSALTTHAGDGAIRTVLLCGMEAHICVYQTARGLLGGGYHVHVPWDATCSRNPAHVATARQLWSRCGALVTTTETVVFDLLGTSKHESFRALSKLLK